MARLDLTGKIFGTIKCIAPAETRNKHTYWHCKCTECGMEKDIQTAHITSGITKSCGCGCGVFIQKKQCVICKKEFSISSSKDNSRKYCYECSPPGRGADYTPLYHAMRNELLRQAGNKCCKCGYNKCTAALHFHHKDPTTKVFELSVRAGAHSWEEWQLEAQKCEVLCANCHIELHYMNN